MSDQRTALVLGGGGITGIAWEIGVLAGLAEAGTDLMGADLVVGTSAGSVVGALLRLGAAPTDLAALTFGGAPLDTPAAIVQLLRRRRNRERGWGAAWSRWNSATAPCSSGDRSLSGS